MNYPIPAVQKKLIKKLFQGQELHYFSFFLGLSAVKKSSEVEDRSTDQNM
jgi:hypothetical protein